jgi:hypothetical protein
MKVKVFLVFGGLSGGEEEQLRIKSDANRQAISRRNNRLTIENLPDLFSHNIK